MSTEKIVSKYQEAVDRYLNGDRIVDIEESLGINRQTIYNQLRDRGIVPQRPRGKTRRIVRLDDTLDPTSIDGLLQTIVVLQRRVEALEQSIDTIYKIAGTTLGQQTVGTGIK